MSLSGKGIWIWKIPQCEGGNAAAIANVAKSGGYSHVLIKIADSSYPYNVDKTTGADLVPAVVDAIRSKGIQVWGWHYVYGYNPSGEAAIAISQCKKYNLDGYVIDAEIEYTQTGRKAVASWFMSALRQGLPDMPMGLSTFRWPSYHRNFPYEEFLAKCDYNMPQVYWIGAHNPVYDLTRSYNEFNAMTPKCPMIPTGPACKDSGWTPAASELKDFLDTAVSLGLPGANIYSWDDSRTILPDVWKVAYDYPWPSSNGAFTSSDILDKYFSALNAMNCDALVSLYSEDAVHVTAERTVQGNENIRLYFNELFSNSLTDGIFKTTSQSGSGDTRHFTWTCKSYRGEVLDGSDTFGLVDDKIAYHYSHYSIIK